MSKNSYLNGPKTHTVYMHSHICTHTDMHMNSMREIRPRAWLCLSKPCLSLRPVEARHYTLSIRIHQWHRNGGTQAFILPRNPPSASIFLFSLVHPNPPPPLLAFSYYLPLLLFLPLAILRLDPNLPRRKPL